MVSMATTKLRALRDSLGLTQEAVIRKSPALTLRTYSRAENGEGVRYGTALVILDAINAAIIEAGKAPVTLDDLGLNIS